MKSIIVGTAGHIDHGKTTLVRALTGIDTDRLEEEKRRGISIDLGFAHIKLDDSVRVAFIDVPGHERFIKNMLAGVGGIDAVMLVIAADESVKPQTREHFDICRLLRIPRGLVALTKTDSVDSDIVELARLEIEEFLAGSFLEGAPIIPVSAATGAGLPELIAALRALSAEVPERDYAKNFRLPVDRSFVIQGFGTVVTGTIAAGAIALEGAVEIHPGGQRARIRGIQVHGTPAKRAFAGQRAALNLSGIDSADIVRGSVVAAPGCYRPTNTFDGILDLLASAKPLKNRAPVHFHAGTAETLAQVLTLDRAEEVRPGTATPVRLSLRDPLLLVPGDRFIVRMFSPMVTIGGGQVLDAFPAAKIRVGSAERISRLAMLSQADRLASAIAKVPGGISSSDLMIRSGLTAQALEAAVPASVLFIHQPQPWFVDKRWLVDTAARWREQIIQFHRANPLVPGISREELRSRELAGLPSFLFDLVLRQDRTLTSTGDIIHLASHRIALQHDEQRALHSIETAFEKAGLAVPGVQEVLQASGVDATRARSLLQVLLRSKRLIRVTEDLIFHPGAMTALREMFGGKRGKRFTVADFKEWTGISRKYAIPLLEHLDRERITRRDGDFRVVL